ncbi:MAG: ABC transporter ATP-binding protein [Caldisericaceae bacterium]|jgi:ABC-2 type transport system ATP-binding protein|nr:ABC transporter ATP-binding protein [Caldisericaceae bacterium]
MSIVNLNGITKKFGGETALNNISVSINEGEIFTVLGKNGAGKTTLIKIICTLLLPDSGNGTVLGYDLLKESEKIRANVSLVAPTVDVGVDPTLTVEENLLFWAVVYGLDDAEAKRRVKETLEILGLYNVRNRWAMEISAGMRQKLGIGRAILVRHPLLLLDEPTVKLDVESKFSLRKFIRDIRKEFRTTILLTTHYFDEAEELSDRVMILEKGNMLATDSIENLRRRISATEKIEIRAKASPEKADKIISHFAEFRAVYENGVFRFTVPIFSDAMNEILHKFVNENIEISEVASSSPTLEETFLTLTGRAK